VRSCRNHFAHNGTRGVTVDVECRFADEGKGTLSPSVLNSLTGESALTLPSSCLTKATVEIEPLMSLSLDC